MFPLGRYANVAVRHQPDELPVTVSQIRQAIGYRDGRGAIGGAHRGVHRPGVEAVVQGEGCAGEHVEHAVRSRVR